MKYLTANKFSFALILAMASISCSSTAANNNQAANAGMNSNANAAVDTAPAGGAAASAIQSPEALVANLYKQHDGKKSPFFQSKDRALVDKYFAKPLADLIWKDATTSKGEVGALDGDPLYNAQDTEIKKFAVGKADIKGDKAEVPVTFENFGKKQELKFSLVMEKGGWKIADINYGEAGTLVKWLSEDYSGKADAPGEFEGKYQIGDTTCTVKPVKMAFEVKWAKGSGVEMFFSEGSANDRYIFASRPDKGQANSFAFDDENYNTGTFYRADGKEFPIKRAK